MILTLNNKYEKKEVSFISLSEIHSCLILMKLNLHFLLIQILNINIKIHVSQTFRLSVIYIYMYITLSFKSYFDCRIRYIIP